MSEETINQLLDKISKFERSEKYLKTDLTLASLPLVSIPIQNTFQRS
jgi:hypothetical protein